MTKKCIKTIMVLALTFGAGIIGTSVSTADQPAFPGAMGFGTTTPGGRNGRIIEVTNLNSRGAGSFRAACAASGARIVVFRTGGTIRISNNINITNPNITIAGQTAPGDGILIRGAALSINTHDVIVRGLRIRSGDDPDGPLPHNRDSLILDNINGNVYNVVVDHCSFSWAVDENLSIWHPGVLDATISNCIISEGLFASIHPKEPGHSKGPIVGPGVSNITFIGNLMAHNDERNPRIKGTHVEVINNLVYNRGRKDVDIGGDSAAQSVIIEGNQFIKGPSYKGNSKPVLIRGEDVMPGSKVYVHDNIFNTYTSGNIYNDSEFIIAYKPTWASNVMPMDSSEVFESVLANAGANPRKPDVVDARIISDVRNQTGRIIDSPSDVGGWPDMSKGVPPKDSNENGIPDTWEEIHGDDIEAYINSFYNEIDPPENFRVEN